MTEATYTAGSAIAPALDSAPSIYAAVSSGEVQTRRQLRIRIKAD
jgi:hypothetical protein